uniref:Uncharacterized protein n=1 Tax=Ciona intestinalis TaxID=7719 RepID=H2XJS1_CIOIN
ARKSCAQSSVNAVEYNLHLVPAPPPSTSKERLLHFKPALFSKPQAQFWRTHKHGGKQDTPTSDRKLSTVCP